jgi:hypothetical protein
MSDVLGILSVLWCLVTVAYSVIAAMFGDGYWSNTRYAILKAKHSKQFNAFGRITIVPIYTLIAFILLVPSCICYGVFSAIAFCVPYILSIFLTTEDNNGH